MFLKRELRRAFEKNASIADSDGHLPWLRVSRYDNGLFSGHIEATELHLPIRGLSAAFAGFCMVQLSDIHFGTWMNRKRLDRAVGLALSLRPDIFLLTGDYLPGNEWSPKRESQLADLAAGLRPLPEAAPTFSILGNHDHRTNAPAIQKALAGIGAKDLTNTVHPLRNGNARLYLAGVDDLKSGFPRLDLVLQQLPNDGPAILLAHEPDFADVSAQTGRFALQVSGHTHGGQVVLPFIGPPLLPKNGQKYPSGLYKVGQMYQYTNRGIGTGEQYIRFNCPAEITRYVLEPSE